MRTIRSRWSLLAAVVTAVVVVSLLFFFLRDTPTLQYQKPHNAYRRGWNLAKLSQSTATTYSSATADPHPTGVSRKVIVVSLARSGSSLTGDIISHGPNVYYVYEPLRRSEINMWADYERRTQQNTTQGMKAVMEWRSNAIDMLRSFLSCHFSDLDPNDLDTIYLRKFPRTRRFATCAEEAIRKNTTTVNAACLLHTESMCQQAKVKLIKVIRLGLRDLEPLLKEYPDLVLILLARDPRASVWSMIQVFKEEKAHNHSSYVHGMCNSLDDDISSLRELRHRYPGRVRLLRYEALAENPVKVSKLLYRFIGLKWNNHAENLVRRQTSASVSQIKALKETNKTVPYSVWREDSLKASRAWKRDVDWLFVRTAQEKCFGVIRQLGYTLFRHEADLRDNTTQSFDHQQSLLGDDTVWLQ
ncbi:carbohydrate sulfotransferase 5-like [Littorina saxatilis]|uniref:Uncharacterized protein n=1 Tax=Littorina saxatilis TaxID=31220 RepID=A0AAN9AWI2_9CAEN